MKLYRISNKRYTEHLNGEGAYRVGGRWNNKGTRLVYTSTSIALASLEVLVHTDGLPILKGMILLTFEDDDHLVEELKDLPDGWDEVPPLVGSKIVGDQFAEDKKHLALLVPSAIVPEEYNVLINPLHDEIGKVELIAQRDYTFDGRL